MRPLALPEPLADKTLEQPIDPRARPEVKMRVKMRRRILISLRLDPTFD